MNRRSRPTRKRLIRAAVALACISTAAGALAQSNPYILRASQEFTYDSNIFRRADNERRDLISTTTLGAAIDQHYGRQRYLADAQISGNIYRNNDQLNSTGYGLLLGMDWEAAQRLAGTIRLRSSQETADVAEFATRQGVDDDKNLLRLNGIDLTARYGLAGRMGIESAAGYRRVTYSNQLFDDRDYRQGYVSAGLAYRPSDFLRFTVLARYTDGTYPQALVDGQRLKDDFTREDYELGINWRPSDLTTIDTRVAWSTEDHDGEPSRNFDGVTGSARWLYRPTAKSRFSLGVSRNTRNNSGAVDDLAGVSSDSRLSTRYFGSFQWLATAKISFDANASYSKDSYDQMAIAGGTQIPDVGDGSTQVYGLGATYTATRNWSVGCSISRLTRSANLIGSAAYDYKANVARCSVEFELQ